MKFQNYFRVFRLPHVQVQINFVAGLLGCEKPRPIRLRYNLMGLTATFEEGIAVFVAIGTTGLAAIHVLCGLAKFLGPCILPVISKLTTLLSDR